MAQVTVSEGITPLTAASPLRAVRDAKRSPHTALQSAGLCHSESHSLRETARSQADRTALEQEIDGLVYKLYDLTPEEIAIVEEATRGR